MKRLTLMATAGLVATIWAAPSPAADLARPAYKAPLYVAPPFSWSGFYIGINGGYGWGKADLSNTFGSFTTDTQDGWLLGGTIGYNLQTGNWVWGVEGDIAYAWLKGNTTNVVGGACAGGGGCEVKDTFFATARGRVGYAWDRFLPYVTGGGAFTRLKITAPAGDSNTNTNIGWTVGAGVEWAFFEQWSAKAEYLYADLGTATCDVTVCGVSTDYSAKLNVVRLGVNYRF
jgi:outer membrane immunogenic protein